MCVAMRSRNQRSWRDHHHAAGEFEQRVFQRAQRLDVEVVGRFVEQQHVAACEQRLGQVQPAALAAGQRADELLLVVALEVEAAEVGARRHLELADGEDVEAAGDRPPTRSCRCASSSRALVDERHACTVWPIDDFAAVRLFLAGDHAEQRRLAGAVRADDADDRARRHLEAQVVDQQAVAEALGHVLELDHLVAQALGHRDEDLLGLVALLVLVSRQLLEARQARLALGLAALRVLAHPLELLLHRLLARASRWLLPASGAASFCSSQEV